MKAKVLLLALVMNLNGLLAQNKDFSEKFLQAFSIYEEGNSYDALPLFLELHKMDSSNANVCYLVGDCYLKGRTGKANAVRYLQVAVKSVSPKYVGGDPAEKNAPVVAWKLLGDAYHIHSEFDKAIAAYETYKKELILNKRSEPEILSDANHKIEMCHTAIDLMKKPVKIKIENMGPDINSPYADYCPVLTGDGNTMIFTTRRKESTGGETFEGKYFEDIFITHFDGKKWSKAESISDQINTNGNEASVGVSPDGQEVLIYKDDNGDGNIYGTRLVGDVWSKPVKLNSTVNTKYWEPSAFISADGYYLYFVSNRPGGYGGRDIYVSKKEENGEWGKAENLGPLINSPYEEDAPFIHPDGVTLFFSSNGHKTMGGFDVFYSTLGDDGKTWGAPVNVGYPVNTPDDDVFYVVSTDKTKAYYSSFKEGGLGEKDNYMITFLEQKKAPLTLLKGIVKTDDGKVPQDIEITITDNETGKVVGIYRPNSKSGEYLFILPPGKDYNISYDAEGFLFYSENRNIPKNTNYYEIYRPIQLPPIIVGSKVVLNNVFFDFDKATLRPTSNIELRNIVRFLNKYPKVVVEISGHTDSKGEPKYNLKLSDDRAAAVTNYLIEKGIGKERMRSKGYGETMPAAPNKNPDDSDNPEGRQLNRRVELKIIEINK